MATLADFIARCEGVNTVLITAPIKNDYFITVRSRKPDRHAGELAEALTSGLGSGGGMLNALREVFLKQMNPATKTYKTNCFAGGKAY
jgi:hypothetical protein